MKSTHRYLTKSRFKIASECPTKLFYTGKPDEYDNNLQGNQFLATLADGGYQVGALAKLRYPNGIEVKERDHQKAIEQTQALLLQDNVVMFEPAIQVGDLFIRIDILVKQGNRYQLIEVKAKSYDSKEPEFESKRGSISSGYLPYLMDVAFQKWVIQQALPNADISCFLMMPDKAKTAPIDGINQMFKITARGEIINLIPQNVDSQALAEQLLAKVCVDQYADYLIQQPIEYPGGIGLMPDVASEWAAAYRDDIKIKPSIGAHCKACEFKVPTPAKSGFHACWKEALGWQDADFDEPNVLDLWNFRKTQALMDQGLIKLKQLQKEDIGDFPDHTHGSGLSRNQRQWMQIDLDSFKHLDDVFYFDDPYFLSQRLNWAYPYHMIDFETASVALPYYKGMRPYQAVAFQFSHHVIEADGAVRHANQFLCTEPGVFPNYEFARALRDALGDSGTVFMWSNHEHTILSSILRQLQIDSHPPSDSEQLVAFITSLLSGNKRALVDLCRVAEKSYFHPSTKGSVSIKRVLPAVVATSPVLQTKYSLPIYGRHDGIPSLNFSNSDGFTWLSKSASDVWNDPYQTLKQYAISMIPAANSDDDITLSIIGDGGAATTAYARLQFEQISENLRDLTNQALLRYCELDTLAMVMVMEAWNEFSKNHKQTT